MKWNWHIGKILNIDVKVHLTFLFLLAWIAFSNLISGGPLGSMVGVVLALVVFSIVLLHELGHAIAARFHGIGVKDITLLPIGGVARLERMPTEPRVELIVAAAGPAVNLVLAGLGALLLWALPGGIMAVLTQWFIGINVALLLFNLIPAFPMDGGRILRALLTRRYGLLKATEKATTVARYAAVGLGLLGLVTFRLGLVLIALFVYFSSGMELAMLRWRSRGMFTFDPGVEPMGRGFGGANPIFVVRRWR